MNTKQKILAVVLTLGLCATSAFAYTSTQLDAANSLANKGIINNNSTNPSAYNLDQNVLRQEIAAVTRGVARVPKNGSCKNMFKDLSATKPNSWACVNVEPLVENNLIAKNENFRPEDYITKAETLGMLIKAIGFDYSYDTTNPKGWQEQIVDFAVSKGIVDRFTDYDTKATRGWVFEVADFSIQVLEKETGKKLFSDEAGMN
ncbi:MAG: S-layer homology domain-containing protein [Candidatus Gracilibacteria bacterium]|nr:S-layer homology domain-containing protein [Candidatus Gracilibacteria bacterium]